MLPRPFTITFLGRSGCGKGTQAKLLMQHLETELYISSGDLFRTLAQKDTLAGKRVRQLMKDGVLPDAWLACALWEHELIERLTASNQDVIFDGMPRWLPEAETLDEIIRWFVRPPLIPILLDITREEAYTRLMLRGRPDDTEKNIQARLDWFEADTIPVIAYYEKQGRLLRVDGAPPPEDVARGVRHALGLE